LVRITSRRAARRAAACMSLLLSGTALALLPATASATPAEPNDMAQLAQANATLRWDIPAQPLADALTGFGRRSGLQVTVDGALLRGLSTRGASGNLTPAQALDGLLAGTGLAWRFTGPSTVKVERPAADGAALTLDPISVTAGTETAWGPVDGVVAHRSATATKTDTPIARTPQTILVVTRDQMDAQGAQTVPQALRYTSGVLTDRNGADQRTDYLFSRGFALDQYLDGLRLLSGTWAIPQIDSFGLERVEVLKGPASVLYGQASPGGLASLVTKRPLDDAQHEIQLQGGTFDRVQGAVDLTGPLDDEGRFLYRFVALGRDADTQIDQTKARRLYVAPSFTWKPGDDTSFTLLSSYTHDPFSGAYYKLPAVGTVLDNPNGRIPEDFYSGDRTFDRQERTQYSVGYALDHRLDDIFTLRQNARYMRIEGDYKILVVGNLQADQHTINRSAYAATEDTDALTLDNQLEAKFDTGIAGHTVVGGVDYQRTFNDRTDAFGGAPSIDYLNPVYGQAIADPSPFLSHEQDIRQIGLYLQDQIDIGALSLVFGGRQDWAESETDDKLGGGRTKQEDDAFTGRVGLLYSFDNGIAPYVSWSESFQPVTGTDFGGNPFEPTTGTQYEIGVKVEPPGWNSLLTLSAYTLKQQNVPTADPVNTFFQVQTGEIETRGIEAELKSNPLDGLNLIAAYAFLDSEVTKSNDGIEGNVPVYQPRHTASLWGDYTIQDGALAGLGGGGGARYVGETWGDAANTFEVPDYWLFDAVLRYDLGGLGPMLDGASLAVNATNLFDKRHVTECQNINTCYYGTGRTVYATLKYRW